MKKYLFTSACALFLMTGGAFAQTSTTTSTTTTAPNLEGPAPAMPGSTVSSEHSTSVDAYGNETDTKKTTYDNGVGGSSSESTTTTGPVVPPATTTTTTSQSTSTNN